MEVEVEVEGVARGKRVDVVGLSAIIFAATNSCRVSNFTKRSLS